MLAHNGAVPVATSSLRVHPAQVDPAHRAAAGPAAPDGARVRVVDVILGADGQISRNQSISEPNIISETNGGTYSTFKDNFLFGNEWYSTLVGFSDGVSKVKRIIDAPSNTATAWLRPRGVGKMVENRVSRQRMRDDRAANVQLDLDCNFQSNEPG